MPMPAGRGSTGRPSRNLTYGTLHHAGLAVAEALHRVEHVHHILPFDHLADDADGAEHAAAASPVPAET